MTFSLDTFISDLRQAAGNTNAAGNIKTLLEDVISDPAAIAATLPAFAEEEALLFEDDAISIWHCLYHPGHKIPPHDHQMPAMIAVYRGREQNDFYEADPAGGVRKSSEVVLNAGDTLSIGPSAIHTVECIGDGACQGFHVYLGNLTEVDRSLFDVVARERLPFTPENYIILQT